MDAAEKITTYPTNWPRDSRSKTFTDSQGRKILHHPDRAPHFYNFAMKRWELA